MTLDIAIATHRPDGAERVAKMLLPPMPGVRYVVSWQDHQNASAPEAIDREDVTLLRFEGKGLSLNRNNAIDNCQGDIVLIADNDILLNATALPTIIELFTTDPTLDFATFRADIPGKSCYPAESVKLCRRLPKGYSVSAVEIAFRRESCGGLRFSPLLGLGTDLAAGEDEHLLLSAINRGLNCRFFPVEICRHPHPSTGSATNLSAQTLRGFGAIIALTYPFTSIIRIPLKAFRLWRSGRCGLFKALCNLTVGAFASSKIKRT